MSWHLVYILLGIDSFIFDRHRGNNPTWSSVHTVWMSPFSIVYVFRECPLRRCVRKMYINRWPNMNTTFSVFFHVSIKLFLKQKFKNYEFSLETLPYEWVFREQQIWNSFSLIMGISTSFGTVLHIYCRSLGKFFDWTWGSPELALNIFEIKFGLALEYGWWLVIHICFWCLLKNIFNSFWTGWTNFAQVLVCFD